MTEKNGNRRKPKENEMAVFKIISEHTAEATENCKLETTADSQWTEIDIDKGDQFYIIERTDDRLFLEGRHSQQR